MGGSAEKRTDRPHQVEGPCLTRTFNAAMTGALAGTFTGACQLGWYPDAVTSTAAAGKSSQARFLGSSDSRAILRSLGRPAFWMASAGAAFASVECLAESFIGDGHTHTPVHSAYGGFAAGAVLGSMTKRMDIMTTAGMAMGLLMYALDYSGPDTVWAGNKKELDNRMYGVLPMQHKESEALSALKEKYPQHKNL
jgi:hypothetical protein